jgi:DNA-binding response OmpR family regulator
MVQLTINGMQHALDGDLDMPNAPPTGSLEPTRSILFIDGDTDLINSLQDYFAREGFVVSAAHDYESGLLAAKTSKHDLIVLDVVLTGGSGFALLRELRQVSSVPVVFVTARDELADRLHGFELGADDYVAKPFVARELLLRVHAILRRGRQSTPGVAFGDWLQAGKIAISAGLRRATCGGQELPLTAVEFKLLACLLRCRGKVVTREELAQVALGRQIGLLDRSVDVHISRLRRKLQRCGAGGERIQAVRGKGYVYTTLTAGVRAECAVGSF